MKFKIIRKGRSAVAASAPTLDPGRVVRSIRRPSANDPVAALIATVEQIRGDLAEQNAQHREDLTAMARGFREVLDDKATLQARVATLEQQLCDDYARSQDTIAALEQQCDSMHAERDASAKAARLARDTSTKLGAQVSALTRQNSELLAKLNPAVASPGAPPPITSVALASRPVKTPPAAKQVGKPPPPAAQRARPVPLPVRSMVVKRPTSSS